MGRRKKLSSFETMEARSAVLNKAGDGNLRWPEALAELRISLGMTQAEFARTFRLTSQKRVSEMENGSANPTIETVERIAKPFGLTVGLIPRDKNQ